MLSWKLDDSGYAYISLTDKAGQPVTSVPLDDLAEEEGIDALESLVLDFDADGKLVGIEVINGDAKNVLPTDLMLEQGYDDSRYNRRIDER